MLRLFKTLFIPLSEAKRGCVASILVLVASLVDSWLSIKDFLAAAKMAAFDMIFASFLWMQNPVAKLVAFLAFLL